MATFSLLIPAAAQIPWVESASGVVVYDRGFSGNSNSQAVATEEYRLD
ncbi:hypothetical protein LAHI110946_03295 [Lactococcus hircilactis]